MTARTVIHSNGRAYRVLLNQPPSYRRGTDTLPAVDQLILDTEKALRDSSNARYDHRGMRRA